MEYIGPVYTYSLLNYYGGLDSFVNLPSYAARNKYILIHLLSQFPSACHYWLSS